MHARASVALSPSHPFVPSNTNSHSEPGPVANPRTSATPELLSGTGKRGHYERGLFTGEISSISKISREWWKMVGFSFVFPSLGGSLKSLKSLSSLESLEKNRLFWKDPFSQRHFFQKPDNWVWHTTRDLENALGKMRGVPTCWGARLVVFPRFLTPYRPTNTTSRDPPPPPSSRDPPSGRDPPAPASLWEGAKGPSSRGGPSPWLSRIVGGLGVGIPRAGSPSTSRDPLPLLSHRGVQISTRFAPPWGKSTFCTPFGVLWVWEMATKLCQKQFGFDCLSTGITICGSRVRARGLEPLRGLPRKQDLLGASERPTFLSHSIEKEAGGRKKAFFKELCVKNVILQHSRSTTLSVNTITHKKLLI